jgi:hypothetical protein
MNKQVSRRQILSGIGTFALLALPLKTLAQQQPPLNNEPPVCPPPPKVKVVMSEISNNHSHEFTISVEDLIKGGTQNYSIKGKSGHLHGIQISSESILQLLQGKSVTVVSSTDAGHSHNVVMKLT